MASMYGISAASLFYIKRSAVPLHVLIRSAFNLPYSVCGSKNDCNGQEFLVSLKKAL